MKLHMFHPARLLREEELINYLKLTYVSLEEKYRRCIEFKKNWSKCLDMELSPYDFSLLTSMIVAENLIAAELLLSRAQMLTTYQFANCWIIPLS